MFCLSSWAACPFLNRNREGVDWGVRIEGRGEVAGEKERWEEKDREKLWPGCKRKLLQKIFKKKKEKFRKL